MSIATGSRWRIPGDRIGLSDLAGSVRRAGPSLGRGAVRARNRIVSVFGFKTPAARGKNAAGHGGEWESGERVGIFEVLARSTDEIVLGDNDRHLDLRVSALVERGGRDRAGKDAERDDRRPAERPAGAVLFLLYQAVSPDDRSRRRKAEPAPAGIGGSRRKRRRITNGDDGPGRSAIRSATVRPLAARKRSSRFGRNGFSDRPEKNRSAPHYRGRIVSSGAGRGYFSVPSCACWIIWSLAVMSISTRRFCARPSSVELSAIGES